MRFSLKVVPIGYAFVLRLAVGCGKPPRFGQLPLLAAGRTENRVAETARFKLLFAVRTFVKNPVKPLRPERLGYPYTVLLLPFKFVVLKRFKHLVENFFDRKSFYFLRRKQRVDVHLDAAAFALFVRPLWTEQVTALYAAHDNGQSEKFKQLGYRGAHLSATTVAGDFALGIQSNDSFVFGDFLCLTQKPMLRSN